MDDIEQPIYNMVGDLVALGPIRRDLVPLYQRWMNDFQTTRNLVLQPNPMTLEKESVWYDEAATRSAEMLFTIYEKGTARPIGNAGIEPNYRNRSGIFGIVIGEADCRDKGYGTEATRMVVDYAFTALGLHNVMLTVYGFNHRAIRCYEKAGFKVVGRRRESIMMGGRLWDEVYMDCLATEFEGSLLQKTLLGDLA